MPDHIIELKPRPRDRVMVSLAGGRFFTIPAGGAQLSVGTVLSDEAIARLDRMDQYFRGKDKAVSLISKRSRTREQVKAALEKLSIDSPVRDGILSELEDIGLIDDVRFTREYVRIKSEVRRQGPYRLRYDLKRLGVRKSIVDEVLDDSFDEHTQEVMARELAHRRAGGQPVDEKAARRIADFLRRKGFDYEVVNHVVYDLLHHKNLDKED
jgi:regulatory protein